MRANSPWDLTITDPSAVGAFEIQEIPMSDVGDNYTKTYIFKLKNDIALEGNKMKFTFTSPNNDFPAIEYPFIPTQTYPNSYIMKPGGTLQIPLNKAYIVWANDMKKPIPDGANITTELVWQDVQGGINAVMAIPSNGGIGTTIAVTSNGGVMPDGGNAVVAAKYNGEIIWSWHLWFMNYDPDKDAGGNAIDFDDLITYAPGAPGSKVVDTQGGGKVYAYNNGKHTNIFMDRVLGASLLFDRTQPVDNSRGYLYQHGRKDPLPPVIFGGIGGTYPKKILYDISGTILTDWDPITNPDPTGFKTRNIMAEPDAIYLEESIKEPFHFFAANDVKDVNDVVLVAAGKNDFDWYSNIPAVHKGDMWDRSDNTKGNYDPCPDGWRVHPGGTGFDNPFLNIPFTDLSQTEYIQVDAKTKAVDTDLVTPRLGTFKLDGYISGAGASIGRAASIATVDAFRFATSFGARSISSMIYFDPSYTDIFGMNAKVHGYSVRCSRDFSNK